ncbi:MAG TPA: S8 family serine peptidase [Gaiellaceae bacterium]|nr:S8 family serine peptidase [Gaiellaceae bacterium]
MGHLRFITGSVLAVLVTAGPALPAIDPGARVAWPRGTAVVAYANEQALDRVLARHAGTVVGRIPALRIAEIRPRGDVERYAARLAAEPGIVRVERAAQRRSLVEPALAPGAAGPPQWQYAAIGADRVPPDVAAAAAGITIAVIDTGADLTAPDLAAKSPQAHSVRGDGGPDVSDLNGHGTFVAALAAGSASNGEGIAGVAGEAKLLIVQAGGPTGSFTDVEEAAAIVYAVDHGARILNLSLGGPSTSTAERRAVDYAVAKGALLVAAVGNGYRDGNPVEYPAALLQPVGSRGVGGRGLAVGASDRNGKRAAFSSTGTHVSLLAPGDAVFSAVSSLSPRLRYPRTALAGSAAGAYGYGSGTSFAAPQVAGAAALVWAANPLLRADEVASILEQTASGGGAWTPAAGFGVLDLPAAVARAQDPALAVPFRLEGVRTGTRVSLSWPAHPGAASFRVTVSRDGASQRVLTPSTAATAAAYDLVGGSVYVFGVAALDTDGGTLTASAPLVVSLRQAPARISLKATRTARRVALAARLQVVGAPGAEGARTVVLESFDGGRWSRAATAVTDSTGRAAWRYALKSGEYRVRARYPGTAEIAAATSAPVRITVR